MYAKEYLPTDLVLPMYSLSPEAIFKGEILLFDVNFFNPKDDIRIKAGDGEDIAISGKSDEELEKWAEDHKGDNENAVTYYFYKDGDKEVITSKQNTAVQIRKTVSKWYNALRNIALVLMMSVLLYIAIRMLLSTVASDKAKYKQMITDWVVSICLLLFMHYIMAFSVNIVESFTKLLASMNSGAYVDKNTAKVSNGVNFAVDNVAVMQNDDGNKLRDFVLELEGKKAKDSSFYDKDNDIVIWPTNLMGQMRIASQMSYGSMEYVGYSICFCVLVIYTIAFSFTYIKRVITLAFLTIIAPFVALTYSIDKISDGTAQGFNKWLKEYIFNLLIQPLHLLIYTVFVSSALEFAKSNVVYSLVAMGFMLPAEKILRSLFNFEKASTPGSLAGAATAATLVNSGLNKLLSRSSGKSSKGRKDGDGNSLDDNGSPSRIGFNNDFDKMGAMAEEVHESPERSGVGTPGNHAESLGTPGNHAGSLGTPGNHARSLGTGGSELGDSGRYRNVNKIANWAKPKVDTAVKGAKFVGGKVAGGAKYVGGKAGDGAKFVGGKVAGGAKFVGNKAASAGNRLMPSGTRRRKVINGIATVGGAAGEIALGAGGKAVKATAGRAIRFTRAAAPVLGKQALKGMASGISKAPEFALKTATGAAVGLAAGTAGTIGAIATGDASNILTYGGGAALAGYAVGNNLGSNVIGNEPNEEIERRYYGEKYEQHKAEQAMKAWKRQNKEALQNIVGNKKAKEMMENGHVDEYLKNEITDVKDMATMEKLQDNGRVSIDKAIATQKYASRVGSAPSNMQSKDKKEWKETFKQEYATNYGNRADSLADKTMKRIDEFYKIRGNL